MRATEMQIEMHAGNLCAAEGEQITFDDGEGAAWHGHCQRLLPTGDDAYQIDGRIKKVGEKRIAQDVTIFYNAQNSTAQIRFA